MEDDTSSRDERVLAPSVQRIALLLNFLAASPTKWFTLAELARAIDISKTTLFSMTSELVRHQYLVRREDTKAYALGPALVSLGIAAANDAWFALTVTEPLTAALCDEFDVNCHAVTLLGGDVIILAQQGRTIGTNFWRAGSRVPAIPPVAADRMAWAPPESIERWLARLDNPHPAQVAQIRAELAETRRRGYRLDLRTSPAVGVTEALSALLERPESEAFRGEIQVLMDRVSEAVSGVTELQHVNSASAPVFGANGVPVINLVVRFPTGRAESSVRPTIDRLLHVAATATARLGGRPPSDSQAPEWNRPAAP